MAAYQDWIDENLTALLEYKMLDASGGLDNTGSGGATQDLTEYGSPTYQESAGNNQEGDRYCTDVSSLNMGWYNFDYAGGGANPLAGKDTGTFIIITKERGAGNLFTLVGGGYNSRTAHTSLSLRNDGGEFAIECYKAGVECMDVTTGTSGVTWPSQSTGFVSCMIVITKESATQVPNIYVNGAWQNPDCVWDTTNDADFDVGFWVHDVAAAGDEILSLGGWPSSLDGGSTVNAWNEDANGQRLEHFGYYDEVMTAAQIQRLFELYWAGTDAWDAATTRTGRNKQRRYWQNQIDGGGVPTGLGQWRDIRMADGSSANFYQFLYQPLGENQIIDQADDADWGAFMDGVHNSWTNNMDYHRQSGNGAIWGVSGGFGNSTARCIVWDPRGFWIDGRWHFEAVHSGANVPTAIILNEDATYGVCWDNANASNPAWYWDEDARFFRMKTTSWNTTIPSRGVLSIGHHHVHWGKGANKNRVAQATNWVASTTKGKFIGEYNPSTQEIDGEVFGSTHWTGAYGCTVLNNQDVVCFFYQSTVTGPIGTDTTGQITCFKKTGSTWDIDTGVWNNGSAHPDQTTDTTTINVIEEYGDDIYVGVTRNSGTNYKNIWHLRWNGSYYAAQSSVPILGDGSYYRFVYDIKVSPDGTRLIAQCSSGGSASGHPTTLTYSRNTTTGALTALDIDDVTNDYTFTWTDGKIVGENQNGTYTSNAGQYLYPRAKEDLALLTGPYISPFEAAIWKHYVSGAEVVYCFSQASGDLPAGGPGIYNNRSSWDATKEGSGHTYEVAGGDSSQTDSSKKKAISLNGSGGWITGTPGTELDGHTGGTITVCAKFTSAASSKVLVFSNASDDGNNEIHIGVDGSNQMYLEVFGAAGSLGSVNDGGGFNDGEWHIWHFCKASSTGTGITCMVDGIIQNTSTLSSAYWFSSMVPGTNCDNIGIGGDPNAGGTALTSRFTGTLDFISVGDVELSFSTVRFTAIEQAFMYKYY